MQHISRRHILSIGLAIFSMFFGAGNLMYPILVGMTSGSNNIFGMLGFLITAVLLPVMGLLAMILFNGNYEAFFHRLGKGPGNFFIFASMMIIGPIIAIPRIVTLSHTMIAPFMPFEIIRDTSSLFGSCFFAIIFLGITFLATFRENRIVDVLGNVISPLLLLSLVVIITKGIFSAEYIVPTLQTPLDAFKTSIVVGFETLDLLGAIFFSSIMLHILHNTLGGNVGHNKRTLAIIGLKAGGIGLSLLGIVYIGLSILGMYHGHGLMDANAGELFREIAFKVLGSGGALVIATAVLMACLSTSIALAAVVGEFTQRTIFRNKIGYVPALIITLAACLPLSIFGLGQVLALTAGPVIYVGYPLIITITLCNLAYKAVGFSWIKLPVFLTFLLALISYLM